MFFGKPITVIDRRFLDNNDRIKLNDVEKNVDWHYEIDQSGAVYFVTMDGNRVTYANTVELVEAIEGSIAKFGGNSAIVSIYAEDHQSKFVGLLKLIDLYCEIHHGPVERQLLELIVVIS